MRLNRWLLLLLSFIITLHSIEGASRSVQDSDQAADHNDEDDNDRSSRRNIPAQPPQGALEAMKNSKPVELTARNFGSKIGYGNVWLIEFYSPNCIPCVEFAPTYEEIASIYHAAGSGYKIKVGRINGQVERALVSRFAIYSFPSFFIVDGFSVYEYKKHRTKKFLMDFAEGGYKKESDPIPFYESPMGPMGLMQGALITTGVILGDILAWSQERFGFSPLVTGGLFFGSLFMGTFFTIVFLAIVITPKYKRD